MNLGSRLGIQTIESHLEPHPSQIYRLTNRWEASLWLNGRQLYLGGFDSEEDAARAYDLVALACKGLHVATNFGVAAYADELVLMKGNTQVCSLDGSRAQGSVERVT